MVTRWKQHHRRYAQVASKDTASGPRHPDIEVQLTGQDGNAFAVIAAVKRALRLEVGQEEAEEFYTAAFESGSYDALLTLCEEWVTVL